MKTHTISSLLALSLLFACDSSPSKPVEQDTDPLASPSDRPSDEEDAGVSSPAEPPVTKVAINQDIWFASFRVHLDQVTMTRHEDETEIHIDATFENLIDGWLRSFDGAIGRNELVLAWQDKYVEADDITTPDLPFAQTGTGSFTFWAPADFSIDDATLLFGSTTRQRAIVPLGPRGQALVALEPLTLGVDQELTVDNQIIYVRSGKVQASNHAHQSKAGELKVTFRVDVTVLRGQNNVSQDHFKLELPDGTISTVSATGSDVSELLSAGEKARDLTISFVIPAPFDGSYVLVLRPQGSDETGRIPFQLAGADARFP